MTVMISSKETCDKVAKADKDRRIILDGALATNGALIGLGAGGPLGMAVGGVAGLALGEVAALSGSHECIDVDDARLKRDIPAVQKKPDSMTPPTP